MHISVIYSIPMRPWTGKAIRQLREAANMTQAQLADWLGVVPMHVSHLELGIRPPGKQTARLLTVLAERVEANAAQSGQPKRKSKK